MAEIRTSSGHVALVDDEDAARVLAAGAWHVRRNRSGTLYAQRHVTRDGKRPTQQMHQFLLGCVGIDHRNGDGLDNRRSNLRPATYAQNGANRRLSSHNTSGFKGVVLKKSTGRWVAQIRVAGEQRHIGTYPTAEDAARAYDAAALAAFGEFARPNFQYEDVA